MDDPAPWVDLSDGSCVGTKVSKLRGIEFSDSPSAFWEEEPFAACLAVDLGFFFFDFDEEGGALYNLLLGFDVSCPYIMSKRE